MNSGQTLGTRGSDVGVIVLDEEHLAGARVTLERGGRSAPWSVTCGIYGGFLHTAFASTESEGRAKYAALKIDLEGIMIEEDSDARYIRMKRFAESY